MPPAPNAPNSLADRLRSHVELLAGIVGPRNSRHPTALLATRAYLHQQLALLSLTATEHTYPIASRTAANLELILPATLPTRSPNLPPLIVGAHYDTAPLTPGADDNASAVAALLEIIRALHTQPRKRPLHCLFYDCEEPPHFNTPEMGSFQHAQNLRRTNTPILGMICLESLGYYPAASDPAPKGRPRLLTFLDAIFRRRQLYLASDFASLGFSLPLALRTAFAHRFRSPLIIPFALPQRFGLHSLSDNRSYWSQGYPAVMLTNTALFRNPHYHTPTDLPHTLDYPRLATLTTTLSRVIQRTIS